MIPRSILRIRTVAGANLSGFLLGAVVFSAFFALSLYVQQVLGYSPLKAGLTLLTFSATNIPIAVAAQALVTRIGLTSVLVVGLGLLALTMLFFARLPVNGSFLPDLLPGCVMLAVAAAFSFVPVSIAAFSGIAAPEAGLASGLINTMENIGGAVGVALSSTLAFARMRVLIVHGQSAPAAATGGFHLVFYLIAGLAFAAALIALALVRSREMPQLHSQEVVPAEAIAWSKRR
jgi:MFS family permease